MATVTNLSADTTPVTEMERIPIVNSELPLDLDQLVRRCMGRIELVDRLLASFENRFPTELGQIEECLLSGDDERLTRLTHQLKGTVANVSASALLSIATRMEESARSRHREEFAICLSDIQRAWVRFKEYKASIPRAPAQLSASRRN